MNIFLFSVYIFSNLLNNKTKIYLKKNENFEWNLNKIKKILMRKKHEQFLQKNREIRDIRNIYIKNEYIISNNHL